MKMNDNKTDHGNTSTKPEASAYDDDMNLQTTGLNIMGRNLQKKNLQVNLTNAVENG